MVSSAPSRAEDIEKWQLFRCASGDMTAKKKVTGCDTVFHWLVTRPTKDSDYVDTVDEWRAAKP